MLFILCCCPARPLPCRSFPNRSLCITLHKGKHRVNLDLFLKSTKFSQLNLKFSNVTDFFRLLVVFNYFECNSIQIICHFQVEKKTQLFNLIHIPFDHIFFSLFAFFWRIFFTQLMQWNKWVKVTNSPIAVCLIIHLIHHFHLHLIAIRIYLWP